MYDALQAETVWLPVGDEKVNGYMARPLQPGPAGGVVVVHHMPGYDEATKETVRRFASRGYNAICPNLHYEFAPGGGAEESSAAAREAGGVRDDRLVAYVASSMEYLKRLTSSNGKVGVIGYCSGGRQAFLAACSLAMDAVVDCYGAFVVERPPEGIGLDVEPIIDLARDLSCPLLGLFGAEDTHPSPGEVEEIRKALAVEDKTFELHSFEGAGHAFFAVNRPNYRPEAAEAGWQKIWDWFGRYLS